MLSPLVQELVQALRRLPGVGAKTAQRMALHLLERDRAAALRLSDALREAAEKVGRCRLCRNLTEEPVCGICRAPGRDTRLLCVVETPADMAAIEQSAAYAGRYFILLGRLSPLDGIGPAELGLDRLAERLDEGGIEELILATSATVEGEATADYLAESARVRGIRVSRIAQGVPVGGELEYVDGGTLGLAISGRKEI
ncbi:MAG: recombination mediator RecR [Halothiobacillaceae bacterium]|jgi:recombination protein RecR|nr:recombination mediator RecR [Halothiobacillaceae bacterium]MDY0050567.1 recombination mediator RecR [Halothiobacillaceae bacterium]